MTGAVVAKVAAEADDLQRHLDRHLPGASLEPWDWAWTAERCGARATTSTRAR